MAEAAHHFLRDGFERTSIDRIAASAKVSKQAIYDLAPDKEALFEQVVRAELGSGFFDQPPAQGDLRATVDRFAGDLVESFAVPRNYGLFRANIVATRQFPALASALHDHRRGASRGLARYLDALAADGRLPSLPGSALDLATRLGGMAVEGTRYFLGHPLPGRRQRQAQAQLAADLFLHGLRGLRPDAALDDADICAPPPPDWAGKAQLRLKPDRFAALCRAAADEFLAHGFESASLDPIIATAGVGRSTIYRQFGNKQGLFAHVIGCEVVGFAQPIATPDGNELATRLQRLCRTALDRHLEPRSIALHHLLVQDSAIFPDLARGFYAMQVARLNDAFADILADAGIAPPPPPVVRAAHTLATFGARYVATLRPVDEAERDAMSTQAAAILSQGIGGRA